MLRAGRCSLVPVRREHLPILFEWETDASSAHLWTNRRNVPSAMDYGENFSGRLRTYYHFFFVIEYEGVPQGFIYSYDVNVIDGYGFVTAFLAPSRRGRGHGAVASLLIYEYLFKTIPLRKLYCDVFGYNHNSLSSLKGGGFIVEGEFKEHRFFNGSYHTMFRLALTRERYIAQLAPVLASIRHRSDARRTASK